MKRNHSLVNCLFRELIIQILEKKHTPWITLIVIGYFTLLT